MVESCGRRNSRRDVVVGGGRRRRVYDRRTITSEEWGWRRVAFPLLSSHSLATSDSEPLRGGTPAIWQVMGNSDITVVDEVYWHSNLGTTQELGQHRTWDNTGLGTTILL